MLTEMLHVLLPVLTLMVNSSLTSSVMPDTFKQSLVKPLLKKPSLPQDELKNYRPVSNLPFMSKIVEKAVRNHLTSYLSKNNLMSPVQSAYRAKHSIETALLKVHNDILCAVDRSCGVILVLLDLSAAFDTIDHNVLIRRLSEENGIKGAVLQWIISYFESRYQSVSIKDVVSNPSALCYGVPQGSVLGPEIFSIYTTPIPEIANSHSVQVHQYADDTQLYISYPMDSEEKQFSAVSKIEKCISDIASWMKKNKLKLNEDKTELLIVTPSRQRHKNVITHINVCGNVIMPSSTVRNLGAMFDQSLNMSSQVTSVCKSMYFQLRDIGKIRKYISKGATETLVHALITSRLDLNNALLYGLPNKEIGRLERVQRSAARLVVRIKKYDELGNTLQDLHWLPVHQRI